MITLTRRRTALVVVLALALIGLAAVLVPVAVVRGGASGHVYAAGAEVPPAPVAVVLGAGVDASGTPSLFLRQRIDVAVGLYRAGRVQALLMSGDNSRDDYDEVGAMAAEAVRAGVPASAVVTDHAGFDTYSSCWRARHVWGVGEAVVVTQPFHAPRAVWTCRALGVDAVAAATVQTAHDATRYGWLREVPAMDKAVLDVVLRRDPRFTGPREHALDAVTSSR